MRVQLTNEAKTDLREIYIYYKENGRGMYARKIRQRSLNKIMLLKDAPKIGQIETELATITEYTYRYLVVGVYKIYYRVADKVVLVIRVFDTRQNPNKLKLE
ncbi:MAG: type II toxin-antitoxin system RelE/ParE family toxin [Saprospiraceae bacterium]